MNLEAGSHQTRNLLAPGSQGPFTFPASKTVRKKFLLLISHPVCISSWQLEQIRDTYILDLLFSGLSLMAPCSLFLAPAQQLHEARVTTLFQFGGWGEEPRLDMR